MSKKKIDFGLIVGWVAPMVVTGIEKIVEQLENPIAKKSLEIAIKEVKIAVDILTDKDKENAKQFSDHYKHHWREKVEDMLELVELIISKNEDPEIDKKLAKLFTVDKAEDTLELVMAKNKAEDMLELIIAKNKDPEIEKELLKLKDIL
jgi:hypothetical protein